MSIRINKIKTIDRTLYNNQQNVRRRRDVIGGFKHIVYATDQDLDGMHIRGLLNGFIEKYLPEFKEKVGMLQTPVILYTKDGKVTGWKYNLEDSTEFKGTATYVKGIGSWNSEDLKYIVSQEGLDKMIDLIDFQGERGRELIEEWLGNDPSARKEHILSNDFEIAKV